jgi:hypothetical protein
MPVGTDKNQDQVSDVETTVARIKAVIRDVESGTISKSEGIRVLDKLGVSRWNVSKVLGIRYQFVRNVLVREAEVMAKRAAKTETK